MNDNPVARTITPASLLRLKHLLGAELSPDGESVAYSVLSTDTDKMLDRVGIWLGSIESGASRPLTAGLARDTSPSWSPDSTQVAFVSTRNGPAQVYVVSTGGGEAHPLTRLEHGVVDGPVWSPDGSQIAFTASVKPTRRDPSDPYRVSRALYRWDGIGLVEDALTAVFVMPASGGEPRQLTPCDFIQSGLRWSPDSREILFIGSFQPDDTMYAPRPMVVDLEANLRVLCRDWGWAWSAEWAAGGRKVAFVGQPHERPFGCKDDLWLIDSEGGLPTCRTSQLSVGVGATMDSDVPSRRLLGYRIVLSSDGQAAFVPVQIGGRVEVYRVSLEGPESHTAIIGGERACTPQGCARGKVLFAASTCLDPMDLHLAGEDGSGEQRLTCLNREFLSTVSLPTVESMRFQSSDGAEVEGWIMKPPVGKAPFPTILLIHGGPTLAVGSGFLADYHTLAGAGYAVLLINHRGSTGYGEGFSTRIVGDWGHMEHEDLMAGVDCAIRMGLADPDRLGCCGGSGGGQLTAWAVGHTDRFRAAVPECPSIDYVSFYGTSDCGPQFARGAMGGLPHDLPEVFRRGSPLTYAHSCRTPTLLLVYESDCRCPPSQSEQFYAALKAAGCVAEMVRFPASFHGGGVDGAPVVRRTQREVQLEWFNRYVTGAA
jgi:dipeptidyl aminopeptidase/acylaminoacyl peptidase